MIELLAPAGDEKSFFSAINCGANAIYLGLSDFSARKNATNFTTENIDYFISYAHSLGVKVYVAVNTLIKDSEIEKFLQTVNVGYSACADAFILQDIFLSDILKSNFKDITLHLSTQAGINSIDGALIAKEKGFERVILARETNIEEIKKITPVIETEIFVHGALCTCFSGHCYMSSYVGANSGNRGFCKQPCRKEYSLETHSGGKYPISLSDLNLYDYLDQIKDTGVKSLKIEGRMRSPEYVSAAVSYYRSALDGKQGNLSCLKRTFNRGDYTKGYLFGVDKNIISDKVQNHLGEMVGKVKTIKNDEITITPRRINQKGDAFKIISNGYEVGNAVCVDGGERLKFRGNIKIGDNVNVTKDVTINEKLIVPKKRKNIKVEVYATVGEKLKLVSNGIEVYSDSIIENAKSSPTSEEEIKSNLLRTDIYPFNIDSKVYINGNPFIPKSTMNKLRSSLYEKLFLSNVKPLKNSFIIEKNTNFYNLNYRGVVLTDKYLKVPNNFAFVLRPEDYSKYDEIKQTLEKVTEDKYLFVPSFLPSKSKSDVYKLVKLFDGIYADGINGLSIAKEFNKKIIAGLGLNIFNSISINKIKQEYTKDVILSQELSFNEINKFPKDSGYKFSRGSIRLMELLYCPFGKDCKNCKRKDNKYILRDESGRKFKIIRYKISGECRFEIYNEQILYTETETNDFITVIGLSNEESEIILDGNKDKIKTNFQTTVGNTKRGVN